MAREIPRRAFSGRRRGNVRREKGGVILCVDTTSKNV